MCVQVLVVERLQLEKEMYFALVMDRAFMVSYPSLSLMQMTHRMEWECLVHSVLLNVVQYHCMQ